MKTADNANTRRRALQVCRLYGKEHSHGLVFWAQLGNFWCYGIIQGFLRADGSAQIRFLESTPRSATIQTWVARAEANGYSEQLSSEHESLVLDQIQGLLTWRALKYGA